MTDAAIPEIGPHLHRNLCKSEPDCRKPAAGLPGPSGRPARERGGPASSPIAAPRPALARHGRWLLDALVVSFAFGGCIHSIHPDYVDFLRDISSRNWHRS
ncbi:hypothetical protein [Methylobacterium sp. UNC300MFChir4.1]|jgi:hypothetical protein|uniref:hypothetical protein n=1 Tax=Methylobacterium sp. UNC300MFChir4.1 TaxID=1502747 RepID=UPI00111440F9|nr:hypothetical protein [Methylobacterium sp. UNC300MFChir4.1]